MYGISPLEQNLISACAGMIFGYGLTRVVDRMANNYPKGPKMPQTTAAAPSSKQKHGPHLRRYVLWFVLMAIGLAYGIFVQVQQTQTRNGAAEATAVQAQRTAERFDAYRKCVNTYAAANARALAARSGASEQVDTQRALYLAAQQRTADALADLVSDIFAQQSRETIIADRTTYSARSDAEHEAYRRLVVANRRLANVREAHPFPDIPKVACP